MYCVMKLNNTHLTHSRCKGSSIGLGIEYLSVLVDKSGKMS